MIRRRTPRAAIALIIVLLVVQLFFAWAILNFSFHAHILIVSEREEQPVRLSLSTPAPAAGDRSALIATAQSSEVRSQRGDIYQPPGDIVPAGFRAYHVKRTGFSGASDTSVDTALQAAGRLQSQIFARVGVREGHVSPRAAVPRCRPRAAFDANHV